ncbi:MAG: RNA 2',3'-cyclic phosphodiesterase [Patescibacteria group bacterium]
MKLHRIFIAINLPDDVKDRLLAYQEKWQGIPARWTTKENLHLTLAFLGNTSEVELQNLISVCTQIGERHLPFELRIARLQYGPDAKRPRMIWAVGENMPKLLALQQDICLTLGIQETQKFSPHLTLARFRSFELQRMEQEELPDPPVFDPEVSDRRAGGEEIPIAFEVKSIEVMESKLKRSGAQYTIVQEIPLTLRSKGKWYNESI